MTHENTENEITGAEGAGGATEAKACIVATMAGVPGAGRARRVGKSQPKRAGKDATTETSDQHDPKPDDVTSDPGSAVGRAASKLDQLVALLCTPDGATLPELASATGWQVHSVRGAMAGALRKKGHRVISEKPEGGLRRYRIEKDS